MSGKTKLHTEEPTEETSDSREVYLRDGRKLVVSEAGSDQLVEIRAESGMVEVRIRLTEQGPVLQMEAVSLQLKASEKVEIEGAQVKITGTERLQLQGGDVEVEAERDVKVEGKEGDVRVLGTKIYLN